MQGQYGIFRGPVVDKFRENEGQEDHYQIVVTDAAGTRWRIPVNVRSQKVVHGSSDLLIHQENNYTPPFDLAQVAHGFTPLPAREPGLTLDFIRGNLFDPADMRIVPTYVAGANNDLNDDIEDLVERALTQPGAEVFVWGDKWPDGSPRPIDTQLKTKHGVHQIHMNQGNDRGHANEDRVYGDGAILFHYPAINRWSAVFLAFQSQTFHTDDNTGHALTDANAPHDVPHNRIPARTDVPSVHIVAALVNPTGDDAGHETITLLNSTPQAVNLEGWSLVDRARKRLQLNGSIPPGASLVVQIPEADFSLSNKGDIISLLDPNGIKVHGVRYTKSQGLAEGRTLVF